MLKVPFCALSLDLALVIGYPKGRSHRIHGPESSGKTRQRFHAIAELEAGRNRRRAIDAEHALDPAYAKRLDVDTENLLVFSQITANIKH